MNKNVATHIALFSFNTTTGAPVTGDGANITPYVSKDYGTVTALGTATAVEMDSTNAKGWYSFTVAQAETNADALLFTAKSSTANVSIVGQYIFTTPNRFSSMVIDAAGLSDANAVKIGPSGSGTAQTARDIGASVLLSPGTGTGQLSITSGVVSANTTELAGQAVTAAAGVTFPSSVASPTNITAGTIATVTNLTNAPTAGDLTATMKASVTTAATAATPTAAAVTGAVGSVTGAVGSVTGNVGGNVVGTTGDATNISAIKAKTDNLPASPADESLIIAATNGILTRLGSPAGASVSADVASVQSSVTTIGGNVNSQVPAIKLTADKLATMLEDAGHSPGETRFTAGALFEAPGGGSAPTAAVIASAVWNEATSSHTTPGSTGAALAAAGSAGDPWTTELETGIFAGDMLRGIAAEAFGKTSIQSLGNAQAIVTFRDVSDSSDIIVGQANGSQRTSVTFTP